MNLMELIVLVGLLTWFSKQNLAKTLPNTIHTRWNLEREKRGTLEREFVEIEQGRVEREGGERRPPEFQRIEGDFLP